MKTHWAAILERGLKIVGCGNDAYEANLNAEANGYPDVMLFKVPRFDRVQSV